MRATGHLAALLALLPLAAAAQGGPELGFRLGAGAEIAPDYFGSEDYDAVPNLQFRFDYLDAGRLRFGSPDDDADMGLGIRGSFRVVPERDVSEFDELTGLNDVDTAVELGLGLGYEAETFEVFGDLRYGVTGHESVVGEVGADLIARPSDRLELSLGPRLFLGSDEYAETYYSVSPAEAAASDFAAFGAEGGVLSTGVELGASYEINDLYSVEGSVGYRRLQGDAADSPIVENGTRDQYKATIGITRRFTLGF